MRAFAQFVRALNASSTGETAPRGRQLSRIQHRSRTADVVIAPEKVPYQTGRKGRSAHGSTMRRMRTHDAADVCTAHPVRDRKTSDTTKATPLHRRSPPRRRRRPPGSTETLDLDNCQTYKGDATLTKPPCAAPGAMAVAKRGVSRELMPDAGESKRWGARSDCRRTGERKRSPVSMWALRVEWAGQSETTPTTTSGCTNFRAVGANADRAVWCTITVVIERQSVDFVCSVGN